MMTMQLDTQAGFDLAPAADEAADESAPCTAELAECTCPDFCERDHANE